MEKQRDKFARRMERKAAKATGQPEDDLGEPVGDLSETPEELDQASGA